VLEEEKRLIDLFGNMQVRLPHHFIPRPYQREVFEAFDKGYKRLCLIWARRA